MIKVKPVFAVLNKNSISLFENEHLSSLASTFPLKEVVKVDQPTTWNVSGIFCFNVYRAAQKVKGQSTSNTKIAMGLCFRNAANEDGWKNAIKKYQDCSLTILPEGNGEEDVEAEGPEIRKIKKDSAADADKKINALEEADRKAEEEQEAEKQKQTEAMDKMRDVMNGLKKDMQKKNLDEEKDRLRALEEKNRLMELQDFLHKNEDCLEGAELTEMNKSEEEALDEITQKNDQDTADMALSAKSKILSEADKQRLIAKFAEMDQLNAERNMNEKLKKMMVQVTLGYEQLMDSSDCFSTNLGLATRETITKVCANIFAIDRPPKLQNLLDCANPVNFCGICCDNYIGAAHEKNRLDCKRQCKEKMAGVGPQVLVPVSRKITPLLKKEQLEEELLKKFSNVQQVNKRRRR